VSLAPVLPESLRSTNNSSSIFGTLGGEADFGPAAYSNAVTKRSLKGKRNVVQMI
jgi:hypothetical protein